MRLLEKFLHAEFSTYAAVKEIIEKYPKHVNYILNNKPAVSSRFSPNELEKN